jgi:hypothetical protein
MHSKKLKSYARIVLIGIWEIVKAENRDRLLEEIERERSIFCGL